MEKVIKIKVEKKTKINSEETKIDNKNTNENNNNDEYISSYRNLTKTNEYKKKLKLHDIINRNIIQSKSDKIIEKKNNEISEYNNKKNIKTRIIIGLALSICIIILIAILLYFFYLKKNTTNSEQLLEEKLITKINYNVNNLLKFRSKKEINLKVDTGIIEDSLDNSYEDFTRNITQYIDFAFIIKEKNVEIDKVHFILKNVYTGYISILNVTINNGTNDMMIIYDENLNKYIGKINNLRNINEEPDLSYVGENNTICFAKVEFYENGNIKNIFIPETFHISNIMYINNIIKLLIPKLSPKLYSSNIEKKIEEINLLYENDTIDNLNNIQDLINNTFNFTEDEINNIRILNDDLNETNATYEQYLSPSSSETKDIELRQIIPCENNINDNYDNNFTNLTEYSINDLKDENIQFGNNYVKTIIYTKIDPNGNLYSIKEIQNTVINNDNYENEEDEKKFKSEIYNKDNLISIEDAIFDDEDENNDNDFNFNISDIIFDSINDILLSDSINNEELNYQLYEYFDSFKYILYNESNNEEYNLRLLELKEAIIRDNNLDKNNVTIELLSSENLRKLQNNNKYYGLSKTLYENNLYKINLLGLKMEGQAYNEIDFSTGIASSYFIMVFGNINIKFNFETKFTNINIIVEKTNQMIFKLITLLNKSNSDLKEKNKIYSYIIINFEKETSELFEDIFDYSGLFRNNLKDMYEQVQNFTGAFFMELIELINKVHKNYTIILNDVKLHKYELLNQILVTIKNEYINYIYNMIEILQDFENKH